MNIEVQAPQLDRRATEAQPEIRPFAEWDAEQFPKAPYDKDDSALFDLLYKRLREEFVKRFPLVLQE